MTYLCSVFVHGNLVRIDMVEGGRVRLQITMASGEVVNEYYSRRAPDGEHDLAVLALVDALQVIQHQVGLESLEVVHLGEVISVETMCDVLGANMTARKVLALTGALASVH